MRKLIALFASVLTGALLFGNTSQQPASYLYSKPTYAQVEELTAAVMGESTDHGPWNDGSIPASYLYSTPTYAQVDRLIEAVKEGGGVGPTGGVSVAMFKRATNALWKAHCGTTNALNLATNDLWTAIRSGGGSGGVGTNDFILATNRLTQAKRDKDDLAVYRKVKDIWTWTNYTSNQWSTADAPADFLAVANSPGTIPLAFRGGTGQFDGGWFNASQFWPNGRVKYDAGAHFTGELGSLSTNLYFAFTAYSEDGKELFRFGARAHRESATDETLVDWFDAGPASTYPIRLVTTDLLNHAIRFDKACGSARLLPEYLWKAEFSDSYEQDAYWYYDEEDGKLGDGRTPGLCSARRVGCVLERNYDWYRDNAAEFVVLTAAGHGRLASVGVANIGEHLTEDFVSSGKPSRYYKCLPGRTVDGVNEYGVAINVNVVVTNGSKWEVSRGVDGRDIDSRWAVRFVLDSARSAGWAASNLAHRVYVAKALRRMGHSVHYAIVDRDSTWLVEDGEAYEWDSRVASIVTNFRITKDGFISQRMSDDPYGSGYERYEILRQGGSITNVWYSNAYRRAADGSFPWLTEFAGQTNGLGLAIVNTDDAELQAWAAANIPEAVPDRTFPRGVGLWQTVHTSVYDLTNLTLRVAVQETDDWYSFQVPASGAKVDAYTKDETDDIVRSLVPYGARLSERIVPGGYALRSDLDSQAAAYGGGVFVVAVGTSGHNMIYSADGGSTWNEIADTSAYSCRSITYDTENDRFLFVDKANNVDNKILVLRFESGVPTVSQLTTLHGKLYGITASGSTVIASGAPFDGADGPAVWVSRDSGTSFKRLAYTSFPESVRESMSANKTEFYAAAIGENETAVLPLNDNPADGMGSFLYSMDCGDTWNLSAGDFNNASGHSAMWLRYGNGVFCAGRAAGKVYCSYDGGRTFRGVASPNAGINMMATAYCGEGVWIAGAGKLGSATYYISTDNAMTWSARTLESGGSSFTRAGYSAASDGHGRFVLARGGTAAGIPLAQAFDVRYVRPDTVADISLPETAYAISPSVGFRLHKAGEFAWNGGVLFRCIEGYVGDFDQSKWVRTNVSGELTNRYTKDETDAKLAPKTMISATNETFAAEVLAVQVAALSTNITAEVYIAATNACANLDIDPALIPQEGTLGTVGGLLVALAAAVALLHKKTKLLKSDGTAEDAFATSLIGNPGAKEAIRDLGLKFDETEGYWCLETEEA